MWLVSTTNVSPSQCPVEKPLNVCSASSGGGGRPSIQTTRSKPNVPSSLIPITTRRIRSYTLFTLSVFGPQV